MTKPMIRVHNTETNEIIDREMSKAEFDSYQSEQEKIAERQEAAKAKAVAKQAILDRLGLTAEELKTILG